jgi:hypothetical protein
MLGWLFMNLSYGTILMVRFLFTMEEAVQELKVVQTPSQAGETIR